MLAAKWCPSADPDDPEVLGRAHYLEERYWKRAKAAFQNALADFINNRRR